MYSLWFLTATWATGAAVEPPAGAVYAPEPGQVVQSSPLLSEPPTLRERLRILIHRPAEKVSTYSCPTCGCGQAPMPAPVSTSPYAPAQPATVTITAYRPAISFQKAPEDNVGHEHDYSWVTGHLAYVRTAGGRWVVRYASLGEVDRYGGSVVLAPVVEMRNFREGDLVRVHGEVLDEGRAVPSLGGPLYRVNAIVMVERADAER
ncbi:MAG TPA: hypothetical protein VEL76_33585 [Gemmataceae bacterium]|nr:hypothetical protein [Gemmataceae bacterium]